MSRDEEIHADGRVNGNFSVVDIINDAIELCNTKARGSTTGTDIKLSDPQSNSALSNIDATVMKDEETHDRCKESSSFDGYIKGDESETGITKYT